MSYKQACKILKCVNTICMYCYIGYVSMSFKANGFVSYLPNSMSEEATNE